MALKLLMAVHLRRLSWPSSRRLLCNIFGTVGPLQKVSLILRVASLKIISTQGNI